MPEPSGVEKADVVAVQRHLRVAVVLTARPAEKGRQVVGFAGMLASEPWPPELAAILKPIENRQWLGAEQRWIKSADNSMRLVLNNTRT